ncbi:putative lipoyltransferase 2, mitochondrial [Grifola frondosa]|uniref:lipoyl(octanoyl) transferase n=1 Tax=Grifola frondosa TaxID=5627 RepID=A0A1C7MSA6_GRIFR|nr:putative lipoyltransferase 2, mitochondrial [Grifola frondosa]
MGLPPIFYHYFSLPLPYARTLALQEHLHALQLLHRRTSGDHKDVLLLLQHRPVYTGGRRQLSTSPEVEAEARRLQEIGADFVTTQRGGQTTYHGPGQIVGYPLLDLGRSSPPMGIREYICRMQRTLESHLSESHGIQHSPSEHTGVFLDERTKIASIGVQVRHRLTTHGFAMNITREPLAWFDQVVACGLTDVKAGCIADATKNSNAQASISVEGEVPGLVSCFGRVYERDMVQMDLSGEGEIEDAIRAVEEAARAAGPWLRAPMQ